MLEQPDVSGSVAIGSLKLALSSEARASLEAVRVSQEAARLRARRETMQARLWFAMLLGAIGLAAFSFGPRMARWWHARSHVASSAQPSSSSPEPIAPATASRAGETVIANALGTSTPVPEAAPVVAEVKARAVQGPGEGLAEGSAKGSAKGSDEACDMGLIRSAPWRLSAEACARRFDAGSGSAALALAVAHAQHARGRLTEAAQWAKRALALDPSAAEAYVLIARADMENGRPDDARKAYRQYLGLAPRGWHKAEARSGVRRALSKAPLDSARDR